ncbi:MAG: extracellular solute-binding protein [Clostridiales bacterium]|nr:extracellular solute-binding protein [Clostridiales bacterium]
MKKKLLSALLATAMTATLLAGCGSKPAETTAPDAASTEAATEAGEDTAAAPTGEAVTLKTVSMFGGTDPNASVYEEIIAKFQEENPNVTVEDSSAVADNECKASVVADFSVGNEPDVLQFFTDAQATNLVATDKLVSIEEIRAEYPDYAKDTLETALAGVTNTDGVQRAVPTTGFSEVLYCNKDLFDQYGLELPTDWDSLTTAVTTFKENGIIPIAVSLNNIPHYWIEACILYSAGLDSYQSLPETAPAEWVAGLETFKTLRDMGAFPEDTDTVDNDYVGELFKSKQAAMQLDGTWYAGGIEDKENTVAVAFPGVANQKAEAGTITSGFSSGFYITRKAWDDPAKRDAAVKFVMAQTSKEAVSAYWAKGGFVNKCATEVSTTETLTPLAQSIADVNAAAGNNFAGPIDSRMDAEAFTNIVNSICDISTGSASAEDVLNDALALSASRVAAE